MRVVSDNSKCMGCLTCIVTCTDHHYAIDDPDPVPFRKYERHTWPSGFTAYITDSCHHCKDASCIEACPAGALTTDEEGVVTVDHESCIGCMACSSACPFDIPKFRADGRMVKCDMCGGDPQCLVACPAGALRIEV